MRVVFVHPRLGFLVRENPGYLPKGQAEILAAAEGLFLDIDIANLTVDMETMKRHMRKRLCAGLTGERLDGSASKCLTEKSGPLESPDARAIV